MIGQLDWTGEELKKCSLAKVAERYMEKERRLGGKHREKTVRETGKLLVEEDERKGETLGEEDKLPIPPQKSLA